MTELREWATSDPAIWLVGGGLAVGLLFGLVSALTDFCAMGAISDIRAFGDWRRMRAWLLAGAVAILGAHGLAAAGVVDLSTSMYLAPQLDWLGSIIGGLMLGYGMVLAGGCPGRNLVRAGAGDLRSAVTLLVMALFAAITLSGMLAPIRHALARATRIGLGQSGDQGLGRLFGRLGPAAGGSADLMPAFAVAGAVLVFCLASKRFLISPRHLLGGMGVGLAVVLGWALTGLAHDELALKPQPVGSLTFVRPASETVDWLQQFTGAMMPTFGVASIIGTVLGAFIAGWARGRLRLSGFADAGDTRRHLAGGALMGIGGVTGLGCTIGQGVTGVSTLALGSLLAMAAIIAGGNLGILALERRLEREG